MVDKLKRSKKNISAGLALLINEGWIKRMGEHKFAANPRYKLVYLNATKVFINTDPELEKINPQSCGSLWKGKLKVKPFGRFILTKKE